MLPIITNQRTISGTRISNYKKHPVSTIVVMENVLPQQRNLLSMNRSRQGEQAIYLATRREKTCKAVTVMKRKSKT